MSEDKNLDEDPYGDLWRWENQCFEEFENQPSYESQLQQERDVVNQKLWHMFQNSATCIAQLHKGSSVQGERNARWMPFQTAAGSVTALYKESMDSIRRCTELGIQHGQQRRTRELVTFLRRRRLIRREDLLAFLSGKPPPPSGATGRHTHRSSPRPHVTVVERGSCRLMERASPRLAGASILVTASPPGGHDHGGSDGLQPFRDALALNSLQGAMSAVSFRPPSPAAASAVSARRRSPARRTPTGSPAPTDSVKRPATPSSPGDVVMDSPTHKRPRLT